MQHDIFLYRAASSFRNYVTKGGESYPTLAFSAFRHYIIVNSFSLLLGNCLDVLATLPDESVQCCVTSPPYWGLRDYGTATWVGGDENCSHKRDSKFSESCTTGQKLLEGAIGDGIYKVQCPRCGAMRKDSQLGLEPTFDEYVEHMVEVFREVRRVLRDDGTLWLNLGDSYAGSNGNGWKQSIASTNASNAGGENEDEEKPDPEHRQNLDQRI